MTYDLTEMIEKQPHISWMRRVYILLSWLLVLSLFVFVFKRANLGWILLTILAVPILLFVLFRLHFQFFEQPWIRRYNPIIFTYIEDGDNQKCLAALLALSDCIPTKRSLFVWQMGIAKCLYRMGREREGVDMIDALMDKHAQNKTYMRSLIQTRNDLLTDRKNMLKIFNPDRLTREVFFQRLLNHLYQYHNLTLRQIKSSFSDMKHLDRHLDSYIAAGYICRSERRYRIGLPILDEATLADLTLDEMVLVDMDSPVYQQLRQVTFNVSLSNSTNEVVIVEQIDFMRENLSLNNYFYKMQKQLPLSDVQNNLREILGDVNPDYAMKYFTTILLKFAKSPLITQKKPDIFVSALIELGYLIPDEAPFTYRLGMDFDPGTLVFKAKKSS